MASNLLQINVVESVLKTVLVFDTLDVNLQLQEVEKMLIGHKAERSQVHSALQFLTQIKVLAVQDKRYSLYARQDDKRKHMGKAGLSGINNLKLRIASKVFNLKGISYVESPTGHNTVVLSFHSSTSEIKQQEICKLITRLTGLKALTSGKLSLALRNELTAGLLRNSVSVVNKEAHKEWLMANHWIYFYCPNQVEEERRPKTGNRPSLWNTPEKNRELQAHFQEILNACQFDEKMIQLEQFAQQWVMPQIKHLSKRNQIV